MCGRRVGCKQGRRTAWLLCWRNLLVSGYCNSCPTNWVLGMCEPQRASFRTGFGGLIGWERWHCTRKVSILFNPSQNLLCTRRHCTICRVALACSRQCAETDALYAKEYFTSLKKIFVWCGRWSTGCLNFDSSFCCGLELEKSQERRQWRLG